VGLDWLVVTGRHERSYLGKVGTCRDLSRNDNSYFIISDSAIVASLWVLYRVARLQRSSPVSSLRNKRCNSIAVLSLTGSALSRVAAHRTNVLRLSGSHPAGFH
jgi:hypothetical protein